jgi:hypothetical protein
MSYGENHNFRREILIHDAERKLPEDVSSEIPEVNWPTLGSSADSLYSLLKGGFKVDSCYRAAFSIPRQ